jgi:hypothetical protein
LRAAGAEGRRPAEARLAGRRAKPHVTAVPLEAQPLAAAVAAGTQVEQRLQGAPRLQEVPRLRVEQRLQGAPRLRVERRPQVEQGL